MSPSLHILTLNIWGTPLAAHRAERVPAIARRLNEIAPDIVLLQETYMPEDRAALLYHIDRERYPHWHYFGSGALGSGLMTFSRFPIQFVAFQRFRLAGRPEVIWRGDYLAGKGIGLARVQTPQGPLDVYNMHTLAQYLPDEKDDGAAFRASNLYEAARFINAHSHSTPLLIGGDFNVRPYQLGYRLLRALAGLVDSHAHLHPQDPGYTYLPENPYSTTDVPERLDYIMLRGQGGRGWSLRSCEVVMDEALHDEGPAQAYSDHHGVLAAVEPVTGDVGLNYRDPDLAAAALAELEGLLRVQLRASQQRHERLRLRARAGLLAAPLLYLLGGKLRGPLKIDGLLLRYVGAGAALLSGLLAWLLANFSMPDEVQALQALQDEVARDRQQQPEF